MPPWRSVGIWHRSRSACLPIGTPPSAAVAWRRRQLRYILGSEVQCNGYAKLSITVLMEGAWFCQSEVE